MMVMGYPHDHGDTPDAANGTDHPGGEPRDEPIVLAQGEALARSTGTAAEEH